MAVFTSANPYNSSLRVGTNIPHFTDKNTGPGGLSCLRSQLGISHQKVLTLEPTFLIIVLPNQRLCRRIPVHIV